MRAFGRFNFSLALVVGLAIGVFAVPAGSTTGRVAQGSTVTKPVLELSHVVTPATGVVSGQHVTYTLTLTSTVADNWDPVKVYNHMPVGTDFPLVGLTEAPHPVVHVAFDGHAIGLSPWVLDHPLWIPVGFHDWKLVWAKVALNDDSVLTVEAGYLPKDHPLAVTIETGTDRTLTAHPEHMVSSTATLLQPVASTSLLRTTAAVRRAAAQPTATATFRFAPLPDDLSIEMLPARGLYVSAIPVLRHGDGTGIPLAGYSDWTWGTSLLLIPDQLKLVNGQLLYQSLDPRAADGLGPVVAVSGANMLERFGPLTSDDPTLLGYRFTGTFEGIYPVWTRS